MHFEVLSYLGNLPKKYLEKLIRAVRKLCPAYLGHRVVLVTYTAIC